MANAIALMEEAKWEMEGTRRAAERYREASASMDPSSLPSGQWLLRQVIPGLIEEITGLQLKGADAIARGGNPPKWSWKIQTLPAKELAIIATICGLDAVRDPGGSMSSITTIALSIAGAVRDELEYRRWVSEQIAANNAASQAQDWEHEDILAKFKRRYPAANRQVWTKWRRKIQAAREQWDKDVSLEFGAALIYSLCQAAPDHFEMAQRIESGRTTGYLAVSEKTTELLNDIEVRAEVARPLLMPMLIPPIPWHYE